MRIAYFAESIPPMTDGVSRTMGRLFATLDSRDLPYRVYAPVRPETPFSLRERTQVLPSVPFGLYKYYRISFPCRQQLIQDLDRFSPDLVHCTSPTPAAWEALDYCRKRRITVVASYHTQFVDYLKYYGIRALEGAGWLYLKWFYNHFRAVFAPSPTIIRDLANRGFRNLRYWPRGIDLDRFSPIHRDPELLRRVAPNGETVLLYVGRLVKEKDLDLLVSAEEVLRMRGHRIKLVMVGDGPMMAELRNRMPCAHFMGTLAGIELSRCYASADVFVFPSSTETFGNVVQEAFASGLPVVGVRSGGVSDLVRPGVNGYLAEPHQTLDFVEKIEMLLKDQAQRKRMGRTARLESRGNEWDVVHGRLIEDYRQLLEQEKLLKRFTSAA